MHELVHIDGASPFCGNVTSDHVEVAQVPFERAIARCMLFGHFSIEHNFSKFSNGDCYINQTDRHVAVNCMTCMLKQQ